MYGKRHLCQWRTAPARASRGAPDGARADRASLESALYAVGAARFADAVARALDLSNRLADKLVSAKLASVAGAFACPVTESRTTNVSLDTGKTTV